jgi:hypothetical protein
MVTTFVAGERALRGSDDSTGEEEKPMPAQVSFGRK